MSAPKIIGIEREVYLKLYDAVMTANAVLEKHRFDGMDQNPKGVRDLVGSAAIALERIKLSEII